ncbi:MAG TPA: hypothetical protein VGQ33_15795 [Vicinamibacteria bacterium]|nr:hypothetical protein [Vicinamibacteria bacterium]
MKAPVRLDDPDPPPRIFLLSPASSGGERARLVFRAEAQFPLALALRTVEGAPLGDVFTFLSGLYFRGKIGYARAFARPPAGVPGVVVITPSEGLVSPESAVTLDRLRAWAAVPIDAAEPRYRGPLLRDARLVDAAAGPRCEVVLLGSVASGKYVDLLLDVFGPRLLFPSSFVGRGDMSRGGLLLRCTDERRELEYAPVATSIRHGARPPRLQPRRRSRTASG